MTVNKYLLNWCMYRLFLNQEIIIPFVMNIPSICSFADILTSY